MNPRIGQLWQAAAARGDIASVYARFQQRIRAGIVKVAKAQVAKGGARTDVSAEELVATVWVLTSPYQYQLLVTEGWVDGKAVPGLAGTGWL